MPRGRTSRLALLDRTANEAVANLGQYHIVAIRRSKLGEILQVKHAAFGWMTVKRWFALDETHKWIPLIGQVIRSGYDIKAKVWSSSISAELLGSGVTIPFGLVEVTVAGTLWIHDTQNGDQLSAWLDLAALALPFGEIWLLYHGVTSFLSWFQGNADQLGAGNPTPASGYFGAGGQYGGNPTPGVVSDVYNWLSKNFSITW